MTRTQTETTTGGVGRRSIVSAGLWATPVVAMAAGAPMAAASGQWDLALDPPQLGDGVTLFSADFSRRYTVDVPIAWVIANHGAAQSPAGFTFSISYDNRIWDITGMTARWSGDGSGAEPTTLPFASKTADGDVTTASVLIPFAIPAGTDSYSGLWVAVQRDFLAAYPNDAVAEPIGTVWAIQPPVGDPDATNDRVALSGYTDQGPADVWGATAVAEWERFDFTDGSYVYRPTSGTITSIGPKPAAVGGEIMVLTDQKASASVDLADIRINGEPAGDAIVFDRFDSYFGVITYVYYRLAAELAAGDVVTFDVVTTDGDPSVSATKLYGSQLAFNGAEPNDPDRRAPELGFVNNNDRSPE
ncbi:hypothetical protein HQQ81_00675 [Microbacteriaceae bacterium VKM Ac-2854]|nr:hypothetical protein [Microbacteriaceae bacterium VKM Ac-2854]